MTRRYAAVVTVNIVDEFVIGLLLLLYKVLFLYSPLRWRCWWVSLYGRSAAGLRAC